MLFKHISPINQELINTQILKEAKLKANERTDYGIPSLKKYPMPDRSHVLAAIRMFNHVDKEHEAELANNIIKKMNEYNIPYDTVGPTNRLRKYIPKQSTQEATTNLQELGHMGKVIADHIGLDQQYWSSVNKLDLKRLDQLQVKKLSAYWLCIIIGVLDGLAKSILTEKIDQYAKKVIAKEARNKKFRTFMNNNIRQVYDKHKDYRTCSFLEFKNVGYIEYLKSGFVDRSLKELSFTFWKRITDQIILSLMEKVLPRVFGALPLSSLIILSAIPIKMILSWLGIKVGMGAIAIQAFDFYGRTVQVAIDYTTNGIQLARPQLYSFKTYKDGTEDLVMTDLPEIPNKLYELSDKEIIDICKQVMDGKITWSNVKQLVDEQYGTFKNI